MDSRNKKVGFHGYAAPAQHQMIPKTRHAGMQAGIRVSSTTTTKTVVSTGHSVRTVVTKDEYRSTKGHSERRFQKFESVVRYFSR